MNRRDSLKGLSAVAAHALFPAVLADAAEAAAALQESGAAWTPQWIPREHAASIEALVETVIPATDTPGAREAHVHVFADLALRDCYTPDEQQLFLKGLVALGEDCRKRHGKAFEACTSEQRHALLSELDAASYNPDTGPRGSFVRILKDLTLVGFFTSKPGATQVLAYQKVPGGYKGCIDLAPDQKTWAT